MADDFLSIMKVLPDPNAFMEGQQDAAKLQALQANTQTQQFDLQQAQQKARADAQYGQAYQSDLANFIQKPTAEGASTLALKYPDQAKSISQAWSMRDESAQNADRQGLALVYSSINNGHPELAQKYLEDRQKADQAAGKNEPMVDALLQAMSADPQHAKGIAAYLLSSIPGGDDFAKTLQALGDQSGNTKGQVVGRAIGHYEGNHWITDYRDPDGTKYEKIKNADGTESIVALGGDGGQGGQGGQRYTGGWTPRQRNGGDNPDNVVDNKIAGMAKHLGLGPDDDVSGMSPAQIAQALTLSEGGAGSLADRNNNPANLRNSDGSYKQFPNKQAGLNAAAALVARKLKNGQTTIRSLVEGVPTGGQAQGGQGRVVATSGGGAAAAPGDINQTGDAYLKTLDPSLAAQVKALSEGRLPIPTGAALRSPQVQKLFAAAAQYDPDLDYANAKTRAATRKEFTSGSAAKNITSFNTVLHHIDTLQHAANDLNNGSLPAWNWIANKTESATGDPRLAKFNAAKQAVIDELERSFRGTSGTLAGIKGWEESLNSSQSPEQIKGVLGQMANLLSGRIESLGEQYKNGMGRSVDPLSLLDSKSQQVMRTLSGQGQGPVRVNSPAEAMRLPSGTKFITPDGRVKVRP